MRLCPSCNKAITNGEAWICHACGYEPPMVDGIRAFAPELSDTITGFDPAAYADLAALEADSFWFNSRNELIVHALRKYAPQARSFLEIGCGTGFVLSAIAKARPELTLTGSELHAKGLAVARSRLGSETSLLQLDARRLPFREEFDSIGAFDVLEHIVEDEMVLSAVWQALRPDGIFIATVPQHPGLWSPTDDTSHHVRRYQIRELGRKTRAAGFTILASTSFVTLLSPAFVVTRLMARRAKNYNAQGEMQLGRATNKIANFAMSLERAMIVAGLRFPFGSSRLVIAKR